MSGGKPPRKPTIHELEAILQEGECPIEILPDGSVRLKDDVADLWRAFLLRTIIDDRRRETSTREFLLYLGEAVSLLFHLGACGGASELRASKFDKKLQSYRELCEQGKSDQDYPTKLAT